MLQVFRQADVHNPSEIAFWQTSDCKLHGTSLFGCPIGISQSGLKGPPVLQARHEPVE
jgi:hypothetical protein